MNAEYDSSGSFWSTPIYEQVHKSYLNFLYSISHFSQLPQVVAKGLINNLSHKISYYYIMIDPVIN